MEGGKPVPLTTVVSQQPPAALQGPVARMRPTGTDCGRPGAVFRAQVSAAVSARALPCSKIRYALPGLLCCCTKPSRCGRIVFPQNSYVGPPMPSVMVPEPGACERELGLDEVMRAGPVWWVTALMERRRDLRSLRQVEVEQDAAVCPHLDTKADLLTPGSWTSRLQNHEK